MHSMYVVNTYIKVKFVIRYFQWCVSRALKGGSLCFLKMAASVIAAIIIKMLGPFQLVKKVPENKPGKDQEAKKRGRDEKTNSFAY